ncbi:DUF4333 domain-containing protein [Rhodococcus sp. SGAir0479]|uniref:DUF4333 domain-containing protein n=1 Tax=Rhodococcus sp. SGAir0479 TaxID=2567884 RepID=UPI0010CD5C74|nr:DUF4333 domain-containing protein [Rhodococcus sp. SGAir0479]QCQ91085.1 DUF4333 domain-containing protein [Rhodococcus sp. SGAir0479]
MGGLQGPDESNTGWAARPGQGHAATPAGSEEQRQPVPGPGGPGPYGAPALGWGQPGPGGPVPPQQWGGGPAWGAPGPAPQWHPQASAPQPPQWGQQPGYPQPQFGAQPPNQWAPPPARPAGGKQKPWVWVGIGAGVLVVLAVIGLALSSVLGGKTLDRSAAERGVEQIVTDSYGGRSVTDVSCPADQKVDRGATFECSLTVDGSPKKVTVTFTDDDGTYEVGRPR